MPIRLLATLLLATLVLSAAACRPAPRRITLEEEALTIPLVQLPTRQVEEKLPRELRHRSGGGQRFRALVDLTTQVDLEALAAELAARDAGKGERRRLAVAALERVAEVTREELAPVLERLRRQEEIGEVEGFAVTNRLLVEGSRRALLALARRPEVAALELETESEEAVWAAPAPAPVREPPRTSWALTALGVEAAWAEGLDGTGVVVALVDSGASARHEQLAGGFPGGNDAWYDPGGGEPEPRDGAYGHGTGVLSCAVGRNPGNVQVGVAPGAAWAACAALPEGRFNNVLAARCADWILRRARPDVVINAWQLPEPGCNLSLRRVVEAWRTAEILPVFAAGNRGPGAGSDRSPANYTGLAPGGLPALSVGGLAALDVPFARSSRGPNSCDGSTFPLVTAPARQVTAAFPLSPRTYVQAEGTSFAAGLVAGAAALLLQRHPQASVAQVEEALRSGAVDLGSPGPDPVFGHGRVFLPGALAQLAATGPSPTPAEASSEASSAPTTGSASDQR